MKITGFKKGPAEYEGVIVFRGPISQRKENLNRFFEAGERDIINETPGKLICGEHYIRSYILSSSTAPAEGALWTEKNVKFLCPYSFWIKEETKQFFKQNEIQPEDGLDYPYDYEYDYTAQKAGTASWYIDHFAKSKFKMTIYGPCVNPRILINGYPYEVFDTLESGEYMVIDSRENTVLKYLTNGTIQNIYDLRAKKQSVFEKIPAGNLDIVWSGAFGFDITLFLERSEPRWN